MEMMAAISQLIIPVFILFAVVYAAYKKVPVFNSFVAGAKEGPVVVLKIFPYILAIFVAIKCFQVSGAFGVLKEALGPVLGYFGIPVEAVSVTIIKPLSGSASLGAFTEVLKTTGPDSSASRFAALVMGSSETTFYILAVYLGAVGIKKSGPLVPVCIIADFTGILLAVIALKIFF